MTAPRKPKKPDLALDPATLRWAATQIEEWWEIDGIFPDQAATRLRARATRIERSRTS